MPMHDEDFLFIFFPPKPEGLHFVFCEQLTICLKTLESLVLEKDLSGAQRGINPSHEFALARCSLAIMAFSSFYMIHTQRTKRRHCLVYTEIYNNNACVLHLFIIYCNKFH